MHNTSKNTLKTILIIILVLSVLNTILTTQSKIVLGEEKACGGDTYVGFEYAKEKGWLPGFSFPYKKWVNSTTRCGTCTGMYKVHEKYFNSENNKCEPCAIPTHCGETCQTLFGETLCTAYFYCKPASDCKGNSCKTEDGKEGMCGNNGECIPFCEDNKEVNDPCWCGEIGIFNGEGTEGKCCKSEDGSYFGQTKDNACECPLNKKIEEEQVPCYCGKKIINIRNYKQQNIKYCCETSSGDHVVQDEECSTQKEDTTKDKTDTTSTPECTLGTSFNKHTRYRLSSYDGIFGCKRKNFCVDNKGVVDYSCACVNSSDPSKRLKPDECGKSGTVTKCSSYISGEESCHDSANSDECNNFKEKWGADYNDTTGAYFKCGYYTWDSSSGKVELVSGDNWKCLEDENIGTAYCCGEENAKCGNDLHCCPGLSCKDGKCIKEEEEEKEKEEEAEGGGEGVLEGVSCHYTISQAVNGQSYEKKKVNEPITHSFNFDLSTINFDESDDDHYAAFSLKEFAEKAGVSYDYDSNERKATIVYGNTTVEFRDNDPVGIFDGIYKFIGSGHPNLRPHILNNVFYVPVKALEHLGVEYSKKGDNVISVSGSYSFKPYYYDVPLSPDGSEKELAVEVQASSKNGFNNLKAEVDCAVGDKKSTIEGVGFGKGKWGVNTGDGKSTALGTTSCSYSVKDFKPEELSKGVLKKISVYLENTDSSGEKKVQECSLKKTGVNYARFSYGENVLSVEVNTKRVYKNVVYHLKITNKVGDDVSLLPYFYDEENKKEDFIPCTTKNSPNGCRFKIKYGDNDWAPIPQALVTKDAFGSDGVLDVDFVFEIDDKAELGFPFDNVYFSACASDFCVNSSRFTIDSCKHNNTKAAKKDACCDHYSEEKDESGKKVLDCFFKPRIGKNASNVDVCLFEVQESSNPNAECTADGICIKGGPEDCGNGIDDNCDGLIDCEDPLCYAYSEPAWSVALKSEQFGYLDCVASIKHGYPGCGIAQCGEFAGNNLCKCWISEERPPGEGDRDTAKKKCVLKEKNNKELDDYGKECASQGGFCIERSFLGKKVLSNGLVVDGSCDATPGLASVTKEFDVPSGKRELALSCGSCDTFCCKINESDKSCGVVEGLHCCAYGCGKIKDGDKEVQLVCCNPPKEINDVKVDDDNYKNYIKKLLVEEGKKEDEISDEDIINKEKDLIMKYGICMRSCYVKQAAVSIISSKTTQNKEELTVKGSLLDKTCFIVHFDENGEIKDVLTDGKVDENGDCPQKSTEYKEVEDLENNQSLLEQLSSIIGQAIDYLKTDYSPSMNLLKNPGFEDSLDYWIESNVEVSQEQAKTENSAHIKSNGGFVMQYVLPELYDGDVLELSGYYKTGSCEPNVSIELVNNHGEIIKFKVKDNNEKEVERKVSKKLQENKDDFKLFSGVSLKITSQDIVLGGTRIVVNLSSNCEVWFDDLKLIKTKKGVFGGEKEERFASYDELCGPSNAHISCDASKGLSCTLISGVYKCSCDDGYKWDSSKEVCVEKSQEEKREESNKLKNPSFEEKLNHWSVGSSDYISVSSDCKSDGDSGLKITYNLDKIMYLKALQMVHLEEGNYKFEGYCTKGAKIIVLKHGSDITKPSNYIFSFSHSNDDNNDCSGTFVVKEEADYDVVLTIMQQDYADHICFDNLYLGRISESTKELKDVALEFELVKSFNNKLEEQEDSDKLMLNKPFDVASDDSGNLFIVDALNKRLAVKSKDDGKVHYFSFDKLPVRVDVDDSYVYLLLIDKTQGERVITYLYVLDKDSGSEKAKFYSTNRFLDIAVTKDYVWLVRDAKESIDNIKPAILKVDKAKLLSRTWSAHIEESSLLYYPLSVATANYNANGVFVVNNASDSGKELVYIGSKVVALLNVRKPLLVASSNRENYHLVFVLSNNTNNYKLFIYKVTSEKSSSLTELGLPNDWKKVRSLFASEKDLFVVHDDIVDFSEIEESTSNDKPTVKLSFSSINSLKSRFFEGVLALQDLAFTDNYVFMSGYELGDNEGFVLMFDNSYKQLDYLSFNSKPLISTTSNLYVASQNNITAYSVPSLKKGKSVKLDKKITTFFRTSTHNYFASDDNCVYSFSKLTSKPQITKIGCLGDKYKEYSLKDLFVSDNVVYALASNRKYYIIFKITKDKADALFDSSKDKKDVEGKGIYGYLRSVLYDEKHNLVIAGVTGRPTKLLIINPSTGDFLVKKVDDLYYDIVQLAEKQDNIFVLLSQKTDKGYKSKIYKVNLK